MGVSNINSPSYYNVEGESAKLDSSLVEFASPHPECQIPQDIHVNYNLWEKFKGDFAKKLIINRDGECCYIVIESLTFKFNKPCVLDIKMGIQQYCIF